MTYEEAKEELKRVKWTFVHHERTQKAVDVAVEAIEKQNADGCTNCKYIHKDEFEMPCFICKRSKKDYWRGDKDD